MFHKLGKPQAPLFPLKGLYASPKHCISTACPGILTSSLVVVRNTPTKATPGGKGLFWLNVQVYSPSRQGNQGGGN